MKLDGIVKGKVIKKDFRDERIIITFESEETFILKRKNGNPFKDNVLEALVGKKIRATGKKIEPNIFLMESWAVIK